MLIEFIRLISLCYCKNLKDEVAISLLKQLLTLPITIGTNLINPINKF